MSNNLYKLGEWKNEKQDGKGIMEWIDGDSYEGDWSDGKRHGHGTYRWRFVTISLVHKDGSSFSFPFLFFPPPPV